MTLTLETTRLRSHAAAAALALMAVTAPAAGAQSSPPGCVGDTEAAQVQQLPGPAVRFGINARAVTGQIGPLPADAVPEDPAQAARALGRAAPPGRAVPAAAHPLLLADGEAGVQRVPGARASRYTSPATSVELQVRYHPSAEQEGDIAAWVAARARGGPPLRRRTRRVVGLQITNEVNLDLLARLVGRRLRGRARRARPGRDRRQGRGAQARLRPAPDRLQLGLPHRPRAARRASGRRSATAAARRSCARSTGSGSTPTRAPSSRRPRATPPATATGWSTP